MVKYGLSRRKSMEKDTRLINIYLKIHHRRTLTMHDLDYLAQYDPECFEKTCKNVVYNIPEAEPIMRPDALEVFETPEPSQTPEALRTEEPKPKPELSVRQNIERVLENIKHLEMQDFPVADIDADRVKSLLGNLYMELLFPHNDSYPFMNMMDQIDEPSFDRRA